MYDYTKLNYVVINYTILAGAPHSSLPHGGSGVIYMYIYTYILHILLYKVVKQKGALRVYYNIQYYAILDYTILCYTTSFYIIACCLPYISVELIYNIN